MSGPPPEAIYVMKRCRLRTQGLDSLVAAEVAIRCAREISEWPLFDYVEG